MVAPDPLGKGSQARLGLRAQMPGFALALGPSLILPSHTGMVTEAQAVLGKHDRMGVWASVYCPGAAVTNDHSWADSSGRNCSLSSGSRKSLGAGGVPLCVEGPPCRVQLRELQAPLAGGRAPPLAAYIFTCHSTSRCVSVLCLSSGKDWCGI